MQQCLIYNNRSLNFFRAICGFLALAAFLAQNIWLVLITGLLFFFGAFSMKFNFLYQLYNLVSNKLKQKSAPIQKDSGELRFVYSFTATLFLISFFLLYLGKFVSFAWGLDLLVSFLTLLASFANFCLASLMYVFFKKIFNKQKNGES
ncbi:hypothetical protein COU03_03070 [bacterium (Candidatus Gribaldobacteria) CG10_big_fil_rev_8_21_14_0_10_41_12]|uniref:DUF4395 domain-containing protein n=1 Tax=bacterium (Candidatus Gribaldobacteria) CG10_big_fil_rev_8_21_14_0_10_41_12 TaxID=2014277 RepID=A0A2H0UW84_9BACT|nr:MAG: hypothetical protein AUJ36_00150 [Parcubacteria group bacterium CG1_02_41_26]PIR91106.1 MAG: hypothetical protein COU03_03070 [bacterium (Candidatus Gribaldobacteria) CG10_big_fil_rev_8_21_14_0_10_41_12]